MCHKDYIFNPCFKGRKNSLMDNGHAKQATRLLLEDPKTEKEWRRLEVSVISPKKPHIWCLTEKKKEFEVA